MKKYQDNDRQGSRFLRRCAMPMLLLLGALVAGCGGGGEDKNNGSTTSSAIKVSSAADIAIESSADYNDNVYGLITGPTLKRWKNDWVNQRPAGITGKLVILQVTAGETGYEYIKTNGTSAMTYLAPTAEWTMTRSNGVISTSSMVLDGPSMDAQLKKYDIDPQNDMIVIATGTGSGGNIMGQGRAWYALRYWGIDAKNLAILNGGNKWQADSSLGAGAMAAADFSTTVATPPATGLKSVKSLSIDNTALQATVGDVMTGLPTYDTNVKNDGIFLWDARTITQYSAGQKREKQDGAGTSVCATGAYCDPATGYDYMTSFQNGGSRQGHPFGAIDLNFTNLLDASKGYSFKSKAELASYMNGEVDASGYGMVDGSYQLVGAGNAYQAGDTVITYCETSFRAMITGIASGVILGHPTRIYDGAMIEWNSLSYLKDLLNNYILPENSPWRTDVKSFYRVASSSPLVALRKIIDPFAANANDIINEDKAYKTPSASNTSRAGGGAAPANPCGG
ncbi:MAG: hypothetical protein ACYC2E_10875 [Sulfuricella sp.]